MTRKQSLTLYHPIRTDIQRHLLAAPKFAARAAWLHAADILGIVEDDKVVADDSAIDMLTDTVLFEVSPTGDRVIDHYVTGLDRHERAFAKRIAKGIFSIWRILEPHPLGGLWVEDALGFRKRRHLMDEALEKSASAEMLLAMRLLDAGPFFAGFGIVVQVSELATAMLRGICRTRRPPDLNVLIYGHAIHEMSIEETLLRSLIPESIGGRLSAPREQYF
jgi:hypothetical protein